MPKHSFARVVWCVKAAMMLCAVAGMSEAAAAETHQTEPSPDELSPLIVTAKRLEARLLDTAQHASVVTGEALRERGATTTPDAIAEEPGVWLQKTNLGGGAPFIRGLTGKQVLILIDGVRFNNSTFRFGPNQYLNTIDPNALSAIEVVRGPGSVMYGSDALGGVVNAITRRDAPFGNPPANGTSARFFQQFSSADRGSSTRFETATGAGAMAWSLGMSYRNFGDLRAGRGESPAGAVDIGGVQSPTGYSEIDCDGTFRWAIGPNAEVRAAVLFARQFDVPRSDRLIANYYRPTPELLHHFQQKMLFGYAEYEARFIGPFRSVKANISHNAQAESRERRAATWTRTRYEDDFVRTLGASALAALPELGRHTITLGVESYFDTISSAREDALDGGGVTQLPGRFPDGTTYDSFGVFVRDEISISDRLTGALGLRWSGARVESDFGGLEIQGDGTTYGPFDLLEASYSDLTWSTETVYALSERTNVYANVARGFRAPNVDDLAVSGDWNSGKDIPNPDLLPETCLNYEVGFRLERGPRDLSLRASVFLADYEGLIQRSWLDAGVDGIVGTDEDLFQFQNVGRARIYGLEAAAEAPLKHSASGRCSVFGVVSYTLGEDRTNEVPVSRIPPLGGKAGVRWETPDRGRWVEVFAEGAARQDRLAPTDESDSRIPTDGTPGWVTFNVRAGAALRDGLQLSVALHNLTDTRYRVHGSGIDAPGLNLVAGLDWRF